MFDPFFRAEVPVPVAEGKAMLAQQPLLGNLEWWSYFRHWWFQENEKMSGNPSYSAVCCAEVRAIVFFYRRASCNAAESSFCFAGDIVTSLTSPS